MLRYQDYIDEFKQGLAAGVFIDDTGSPGLQETPDHLHPDRKTWVAVIVNRNQISEVVHQIPGAISELREITGAKEFHFVRIYGGRGDFATVPESIRLAIFRFMAFIFSTYKFPVIVQTLDPESLADLRSKVKLPDRLGVFNLSKHSDAAFFLLLWRLQSYLKSLNPPMEARIFVDEGYKKNGAALSLPFWKASFRDGLVCFGKSDSILPLQLADFAAFSLNRSQLVLGKDRLSPLDQQLMEILSPIAWNYVNLNKTILTKGVWN